MNVNHLIMQAMKTLKIPCEPGVFDESRQTETRAGTYILFNYADERPVLRADDVDLLDRTDVQVHCFTRSNPQTYKKKIRHQLREAGFTILATREFYENDRKLYHIVVEGWIEGIIDDQED